MSKEYLEAFDILLQHIETEADWSDYEKVRNAHKIVEQALQRLESIDNSTPSEALECLEKICVCARVTGLYKKEDEDVVKQALLKAQEPKHYLKWEDLEFSYDMKNIKVKMGDNEYIIRYFLNALDDYDCFLCDDEANQLIRLYKQFFNNLHLERVE